MSRNFTPDETLIDNLLLDDTSAFEELYRRYCYPLYTYCTGKLNSPDDAKAIVRDIFIILWEKRRTLPINFSISAYLYTEVRKAVVNCVNEKLNNDQDMETIQKLVIPGFDINNLQKARQPVKTAIKVNTPAPLIYKKRYEEQWWNQIPLGINLKGFKYAFQKVLHLF
jgi:DNA-directed RNA polymerase specialized sigma24 family protein